jgi:GTPase SAR1 family protein
VLELLFEIIMAQEVEKRVLAKVIMLGNMGVGKTTLMNRYIDGNSAES